MAKRRKGVNKSQMIRDALAANPDKSPAEISALLKDQGLKVSSPFVSVIKSKAKRKAGVKAKRGRRKMVRVAPAASGGAGVLASAVAFVRAAGSLSEAKAALASIEEIGALVR